MSDKPTPKESEQAAHDPETEEDTASGGPAD
jgi:hypothetical protein